MTPEKAQIFVDELRNVCAQYNVVLVGVCESEGIYGEISIREADEKLKPWDIDLAERVDNQVKFWCTGSCYVTGIGDLRVET